LSTREVLVLGGGVAGIQAAFDLGEMGVRVHLVEEKPSIGGHMAQLDKTFPTNDCSICILSPKMSDCYRHPDVVTHTCTDVLEIKEDGDDLLVKLVKRARYVNTEMCTGCGKCAEKCPVKIPNEFDMGLRKRGAAHILYPQAVPLVAAIDPSRCLYLTKGVCRICEKFCDRKAIDLSQKDQEMTLRVGAVIVAPGADVFDARLKTEYGYGRFKNVVSSLEFERILSASGPYEGHVVRPSDRKVPKKIAFIQCVGSRDPAHGRGHCSSVCCMHATKQATIAKEHVKEVEPTIFYMDIRSYGKDFERYVERAKKEQGVRFIRFRVPEVSEDPDTNDLKIRYETENGELREEIFNLVVLSVGLEVSGKLRDLASRLGLDLEEHGFCRTQPFRPLETSRNKVYVCGAFSSPKDIPESVMQGSAAACLAAKHLPPTSGQPVAARTYPPEVSVSARPPRVGVFVCDCGINIRGVIDVPAVVEYAKTLPGVAHAEENLYSCSQDARATIIQRIKEHGLNRVVVASCSPRTHEPLFRETIREAGLNKYLFEMANIRDQCSWVHMEQPEAATEKAKDLVRMAVSKARKLEPLNTLSVPVDRRCLVIGGGLSGMTAAMGLAEQGIKVYLLERENQLGGIARKIHFTLQGYDVQSFLMQLIEEVHANPLIEVLTDTSIKEVSGYVGNFETHAETGPDRKPLVLRHGATIVATGGQAYEPTEYLYGMDPRVVTQQELEEILSQGQLEDVRDVVMIQCVGSRDDGHPYCSRVCCQEAVKNALKIKEVAPSARVAILYRDIRTYGLAEDYYRKALEAGVLFIRYDEDRKPIVARDEEGRLRVEVYEPVVDEEIALSPDLLVLSVGIVPQSGAASLAKRLKVPLNQDGFFLEAHMKLRPVDFATDGVFLCGLAHAPKNIEESISQAYAAASRAATILTKESIETEGTIARVLEARCNGCGLCVEVCAYNAIELDAEKGVAKVSGAVCKGCGACAASCRSGAIDLSGFTVLQIVSVLRAFREGSR